MMTLVYSAVLFGNVVSSWSMVMNSPEACATAAAAILGNGPTKQLETMGGTVTAVCK